MSAIYKEGYWYGGAVDAKDISIKIGQNNLELAETVQNIVKDLAPIETNSTNATTSYKTGDLLTHNGVLYRVINNITAGDPLIEGTNITETTITQGVDLTNRVVALENKTQKISQISNNDGNYLQVDDKGLKINNLFLAGSNGATTVLNDDSVGLLLRKPERSIDVYINGDNTAGIYDRGNAKWILRSDSERSEIKTDASTFVCGSTATTGKFRFRAANNFHAIDLLTSDNGKCGILDVVPDKWLIFLEAAASTSQPNTIKTSYPFYLNSTTVANLTSRGNIQAGSTSIDGAIVSRITNQKRDISLHANERAGIYDHKADTTGGWLIYGTCATDPIVYVPRRFHANATTVNGNLNAGNTTVTSLNNTGASTLHATTTNNLTVNGTLSTTGEILTSGSHLSAGTTTSTAQHVCRVRNKYRNIQLTTSSGTAQAGIYDNGIISGGSWKGGSWIIYSTASATASNVEVHIPHKFITEATTVSSLNNTGASTLHATTVSSLKATGNSILAATTANVLMCGNVINPSYHYPVILSYGPTENVQIGMMYANGENAVRVQSKWGKNQDATGKNIAIATSDRRLKNNIQKTTKFGLDLINKLDIVEFDWKNSKRHWNYGIIAQDAAKIDKNIVIGEQKEDEYLSIDTLYLVDALVKATQELSAEVDQLKERVKILEKEKDKKSQ